LESEITIDFTEGFSRNKIPFWIQNDKIPYFNLNFLWIERRDGPIIVAGGDQFRRMLFLSRYIDVADCFQKRKWPFIPRDKINAVDLE
jgi:hypothetical protein